MKCFKQHKLHPEKCTWDRWCLGCAMPLYGVGGWWCKEIGARFARALRRRRSSNAACAPAETACIAKGCRFVCCDDCSNKHELFDVILRVPYVNEFGITKTQPATTAMIDVCRACACACVHQPENIRRSFQLSCRCMTCQRNRYS